MYDFSWTLSKRDSTIHKVLKNHAFCKNLSCNLGNASFERILIIINENCVVNEIKQKNKLNLNLTVKSA